MHSGRVTRKGGGKCTFLRSSVSVFLQGVCVCVRVCACVRACVRACVCVCMPALFVYMYALVYVCIHLMYCCCNAIICRTGGSGTAWKSNDHWHQPTRSAQLCKPSYSHTAGHCVWPIWGDWRGLSGRALWQRSVSHWAPQLVTAFDWFKLWRDWGGVTGLAKVSHWAPQLVTAFDRCEEIEEVPVVWQRSVTELPSWSPRLTDVKRLRRCQWSGKGQSLSSLAGTAANV